MFEPTDPLYPFFTIFSFFGFLLPLIPLTWHLQAWNAGTCFYMFWASLISLVNFVDSIVWAGNVLNVAPVWCDIAIRIIMTIELAIPLSSLCIIRRLYLITSAKSALTRLEKRHILIFDTTLCVVIPLLYMALHYIIQGRRFDIFEEFGCQPHIYPTVPALFIDNAPPIIAALVSSTYGIRCLIAIYRHHQELQDFFESTNAKTFTSDRYIPIVILTLTEMICTTPIATFPLVLNIERGPRPWISWENVHYDYMDVVQRPSVFWRNDHYTNMGIQMQNWVCSSCGILIFIFFGFTKEARKHYRAAFLRCVSLITGKKVTKILSDCNEAMPDNSLTETQTLPIVNICRQNSSDSESTLRDEHRNDHLKSPVIDVSPKFSFR